MTRDSQPDLTFRVKVADDGGPAPTEGGAGDALDTERASATPSRRPPRDAGLTDLAPAVASDEGIEGPLEPLQRWFSAVMTHPDSASAGVGAAEDVQRALGASSVEHIVRPSAKLSATQRMGIYHYAYHARLVDCVRDDFEVVGHAMGSDRFYEVCLAYVQAHPSQSPNLNVYAEHFPRFVGALDDPSAAFWSDLARLEWAMIEVLHSPAGRPLDTTALQAASPEQWAALKLFAAPTLRFEVFDYPVNAYFQAVRDDADPPMPSAEWSATAIYRQDWLIWRMGFTRPMAEVLQALLRGAPLGEALARLQDEAVHRGEQAQGTDVMKWFQEWMQSGFFDRLEL